MQNRKNTPERLELKKYNPNLSESVYPNGMGSMNSMDSTSGQHEQQDSMSSIDSMDSVDSMSSMGSIRSAISQGPAICDVRTTMPTTYIHPCMIAS